MLPFKDPLVSLAKLYVFKNDQAFIMLLGFDLDSFNSILQELAPIFDKYPPFNSTDGSIISLTTTRGPRGKVCTEDCVALVEEQESTERTFFLLCRSYLSHPKF